jgi:uncharacterized membrane protein
MQQMAKLEVEISVNVGGFSVNLAISVILFLMTKRSSKGIALCDLFP